MTAQLRDRLGVVVTGIGMVTPVGVTTGVAWKATCAGSAGAADDPRLAGLGVSFSCAVTGFDAEQSCGEDARRMDPFTQFAVAAARAAVADAGVTEGSWDPSRVGVVLGTGIGGQQTWEEQGRRMADRGPRAVNPLTVPRAIANIVSGTVALDLGLHGPSLSVSTACASGTTALGVALDLLRAGRCDVVLAGGTEATVTPLVTTAFDRLKALSRNSGDPARASRPFDAGRDGFVLGEGASVLVLERAQDARARGLRGYARLLGYGASSDAHHLTAPDPEAHGARLALRQALADAGVGASDVSLVNAHATGTPQGDAVEARLLAGMFGTDTAVTSTKGVTGHMLGAAGAVEAAFTALSIDEGVIPPTANFETPDPDLPEIDLVHGEARHTAVPVAVSNSFGFGGHNAVVVLGGV
ncbi:3-oxoacyl-[acyl-carrier-protein] synthase II [Streptomyces griseochromogenes]|uniref:3-oxoacyl-ACP synthase n=1 Tax=Streptomyces griseochromogenes TaxID=68214 RepID=A0A1B1AV88_9ACTN|nr:beta-ketoacyl-[acyl-carrier-protein] synthase family protein [Streptomyces griseochromogenes]ANP50430.1 3-oxoacyl-ACP synthase [Streptomyces griseochromogenes]MBP2047869.1 3-oxoacyl-[acyl-carrier-protein] synthase II [Streptomyces griseochromogenes]